MYQKAISYQSGTGRRYTFKDYFSDKRKTIEVSHTETRNYPIQGFATGDLVLAALGEVWRKVLTKYGDDVKLVGLVHDSLRFDLKLDRLDDLVRDLKYTLENSGEALNKACKRDVWDLPIKVSFSKGTDFFNMEEFDFVE
jgi:DNA polymerase I-like protein with 3'-5' exonuclease and polymerase domains